MVEISCLCVDIVLGLGCYSLCKILNKFDYKVSDDLITHGPERDGDIKSSPASIEKISKNLGYYPYINFYEGLNKLISYQVEL